MYLSEKACDLLALMLTNGTQIVPLCSNFPVRLHPASDLLLKLSLFGFQFSVFGLKSNIGVDKLFVVGLLGSNLWTLRLELS
jgi:hypothetical protein